MESGPNSNSGGAERGPLLNLAGAEKASWGMVAKTTCNRQILVSQKEAAVSWTVGRGNMKYKYCISCFSSASRRLRKACFKD